MILKKLHNLADEPLYCILDKIQFKNYFSKYIDSGCIQKQALGLVCNYENNQECLCSAIAHLLKKDCLKIPSSDIITLLNLQDQPGTGAGFSFVTQCIINHILTKKSSDILVFIEGLTALDVNHNNFLNILRYSLVQSFKRIRTQSKLAKSSIDPERLFFVFSTKDSTNIPLFLQYNTVFIRLRMISKDEKIALLHSPIIQKQFPVKFSVDSHSVKQLFMKYGRVLNMSELTKVLQHALASRIEGSTVKNLPNRIALNEQDFESFFRFASDDCSRTIPRSAIGAIHAVGISNGHGIIQQYEVKSLKGTGAINLCCSKSESLINSINIALLVIHESLGDSEADVLKKTDLYFNITEDRFHINGRSSVLAVALCIYSALHSREIEPLICATGELDLNGNVRPVASLIDKIITVYDHNFRKILIPACQQPLLKNVPEFIQKDLQIIPVTDFNEAVKSSIREAFRNKSLL